MKFIQIWRAMPSLVYQQADLLRDEVAEALERQGLPVPADMRRECLLFILWSVHVALVNIRPIFLRAPLVWLHRRRIMRRECDLLAHYDRRRIEALYGVWSIMATQTRQGWEIAMTPRSARIFADKAAVGRANLSSVMLERLFAILRQRNSICLSAVLAN